MPVFLQSLPLKLQEALKYYSKRSMKVIYDFHTHTFLSDGAYSSIELVRCAYSCGYARIAVTDHVSYSNIDEIYRKKANK
jgi:predicted metal-dependent phosphoesterase TrpH